MAKSSAWTPAPSANPVEPLGACVDREPSVWFHEVFRTDGAPYIPEEVEFIKRMTGKVKGSALDGRTTRHAGYAVSQRKRKRIEEAFGWGKTVGTAAKTMLRGIARVGFQFTLNMTAYNLACLPRLLAA